MNTERKLPLDENKNAAPLVADMQTLTSQLGHIVSLGEGEERVGDLTVDKIPWERRYKLILAGASVALEKLVAPAGSELTGTDVAGRMERDGAVKEAPDFREQVQDESRTNRFTYTTSQRGRRGNHSRSSTETEGLQELHRFLTDFLSLPERVGWDKARHQRDVSRAQSMLDNLTFIGEKELQEASTGIAEYWKAFLDGDPNRQICVLAATNQLERYEQKRKSDDYMRERVLQTLSYDELNEYSGRIVGSLDDLHARPNDAKIILIDDWTISGQQIRDVYNMLYQDEKFREYADAGRVEANLVVADRNRVSLGLALDPNNPANGRLKVRAYYLAHHSKYVSKEGQSNLASAHSTPDGDFRNTLQGIVSRYGRYDLVLPKLARIKKNYPLKPNLIKIKGDKLQRESL